MECVIRGPHGVTIGRWTVMIVMCDSNVILQVREDN